MFHSSGGEGDSGGEGECKETRSVHLGGSEQHANVLARGDH